MYYYCIVQIDISTFMVHPAPHTHANMLLLLFARFTLHEPSRVTYTLTVGSGFVQQVDNFPGYNTSSLHLPGPTIMASKGGLHFEGLRPLLDPILDRVSILRSCVVLHLGASNTVPLGCLKSRLLLCETILYLHAHLPRTTLVWSDTFPH